MSQNNLIEKELAAAEAAWNIGNEGKARVCARRAMALADDVWLANNLIGLFAGMPWRILDGFSRIWDHSECMALGLHLYDVYRQSILGFPVKKHWQVNVSHMNPTFLSA